MTRSILLGACLFLASCTGTKKLGPFTSQPLSISFTQSRSLELEPCGCSFGQAGGVEREQNLLSKWRSESGRQWLHLTGGKTFAPVEGSIEKQRTHYALKAKVLLDAMNGLGVSIFAPGANDFEWQPSELKSWQTASRFPWLSTNVFDKKTGAPVFESVIWINRDKQSIAVVSAAAAATSTWADIKSPEQSIRDALKDRRPDLLVVISELDDMERTRLAKAFPVPMLILGQRNDHSVDGVAQWDSETLFQSPMSRGRAVSRVDLPAEVGATWFNETTVAEYRAAIAGWESSEANLRTQLKKASANTPLHKSLSESWFEVNHSLARAKEITGLKSGSSFAGDSVLLGNDWVQPSNALGKLVEKFHAQTRDQALATTH